MQVRISAGKCKIFTLDTDTEDKVLLSIEETGVSGLVHTENGTKKFHQHVWRCIFVKQKVKKNIKYSLVH